MIKNIGHLFMLFAVLLSTTGVSLHKHYSDGKFYSFALYTEAESCCESDCDCCKDEVEFLLLDIDFLNSSQADTNFKESYTVNNHLFAVLNDSCFNSEFKSLDSKLILRNLSPPNSKDIKLFTQVFIC